MVPWLPGDHRRRDLLPREASTHREAVPQRLGDTHDVRGDARPLVSKESAGAAHAALHLVEDEHQARFVCERTQALQELVRRRMDAALALDRLDQQGRGLVADCGTGRIQIIEIHLVEGIHGRLESLEVLGLRARRDGRKRPPVKGVAEGDHAVALGRAAAGLVDARELDRALHRLGAGIAEQHTVGEGRGGEPLGEARLRRNVIEVGDVPKLFGLPLQRGDHMRVRMAEAGHADAAAEIQVALAVGRVEVRSLAPLEGEVETAIVGHQ